MSSECGVRMGYMRVRVRVRVWMMTVPCYIWKCGRRRVWMRGHMQVQGCLEGSRDGGQGTVLNSSSAQRNGAERLAGRTDGTRAMRGWHHAQPIDTFL